MIRKKKLIYISLYKEKFIKNYDEIFRSVIDSIEMVKSLFTATLRYAIETCTYIIYKCVLFFFSSRLPSLLI